MSRIFVCGDTHGDAYYDSRKLNSRRFRVQRELTKDDVVIQLGDFGWLWHPLGANKEQDINLKRFAAKPYTLAVIPGNHDNYDLIESLERIVKWDATVRVLRMDEGEIYFLERGEVYHIGGRRILTIGGAMSTDKASRTPGLTWWERELLDDQEMERARSLIDAFEGKFDHILTHTSPARFIPEILSNNAVLAKARSDDPVAKFLDEVYENTTFKSWHCGHFHKDIYLPHAKLYVHYNEAPMEIG